MKDKNYKDMSVGEGLITALRQAVDYEKGKEVKGVSAQQIGRRCQESSPG